MARHTVQQRDVVFPQIVAALIAQDSKSKISRDIGITRVTLDKWMDSPKFKKMWDETLALSVKDLATSRETALVAIQSLLPTAVEQMTAMLKNPHTPASAKWRIIQSIFDFAEMSSSNTDGATELRDFLRGGQINIMNMGQQIVVKANIDKSYLEALQAILPSDIVETEVRVLDSGEEEEEEEEED